jgi:hypothetical protein
MLKIIPKNKTIRAQEADLLIEKYYEGMTTRAEEKQLHHFLKQENLPERFAPERAMFGYFDSKKQKPVSVMIPLIRWTSVAAAIIGILFVTRLAINEKQSNYVVINGHKYTDTQVVKEQALASLETLSASSDEVEKCAKDLNDEDLIASQLQIFSEND